MAKLEFVDAQEMHRNHPNTFDVPNNNRLGQLKKGSYVKVSIGNERFWAQITEIKDLNHITAIVDNDLVNTDIHGIKYKDTIQVERCHVFDVIL